jgi:hypothetical protein
MASIMPASALTWRKSASGYAVYLRDKGRTLATVERDSTYPNMWRIHQPDGWISDMARFEWAKEGAIRTVLAQLNRKESGVARSHMRQMLPGGTTLASSL